MSESKGSFHSWWSRKKCDLVLISRASPEHKSTPHQSKSNSLRPYQLGGRRTNFFSHPPTPMRLDPSREYMTRVTHHSIEQKKLTTQPKELYLAKRCTPPIQLQKRIQKQMN